MHGRHEDAGYRQLYQYAEDAPVHLPQHRHRPGHDGKQARFGIQCRLDHCWKSGALHEHDSGTQPINPPRHSLLYKFNADNYIDPDVRAGINESSGAFSAFPSRPESLPPRWVRNRPRRATRRPPARCRSSRSCQGHGRRTEVDRAARPVRLHGRLDDRAALVPGARNVHGGRGSQRHIIGTLAKTLQGPLDAKGILLSRDLRWP